MSKKGIKHSMAKSHVTQLKNVENRISKKGIKHSNSENLVIYTVFYKKRTSGYGERKKDRKAKSGYEETEIPPSCPGPATAPFENLVFNKPKPLYLGY